MRSRAGRLTVLALTLVFILAFASPAAAHELYFLNPEEGRQGETVAVKLYWGHFPNEPDPKSNYFAQVPGGRLYVLAPDGREIDLKIEVRDDHFVSAFTPETGGDHQVVFVHDRGVLDWKHSEPQGIQRVITAAKGFIPVDGEPDIHAYDRPAGLDLELIPLTDIGHFHAGSEFRGEVRYLGAPLAGAKVYAVGPAKATDSHDAPKTIELTSGADGVISFVPDAEGTWMLKLAHYDGDRPGELDGRSYEGVRYSLTTFFPVHGHGGHAHTADATQPQEAAATGGISGTAWMLGAAAVLAAGAAAFLLLGRKKTRT
ncbi:DUF4198 domain-containing protein [Candidatus Desulforudis audaxviator]|uniref:ABC-type Co2+ transport system periplasmic component-like protein n=1 Tax=Desulforudis audaxviator (strain MP104C) TaxID=477974 RepID=B1I589_DESAP|nr:DUF4198 domain-containing protein [Candidatus Desulforudis audaxviator]ACA60141.1 ABC-type Co2+ transport system periplasmic component-like protein [Candidatus Desulforudis audaxviator MP104C]AZK60177.1 hypothetical protein Daudx_1633 [Candidatus Desulforudis audaxviator]